MHYAITCNANIVIYSMLVGNLKLGYLERYSILPCEIYKTDIAV